MRILYPELHPFEQKMLEVDPLHRLYVEQSGQIEGIPILFVHGGPGGGTQPVHRRFFDPERYRIILFDQRGCGRSTPYASLERNTTQDLVEDMEVLRRDLGVERWVLFGGSWGSTLSLAYAQAHPEHVMAMILRGIFLCRPQDIKWFYQEGASRVFPDAFDDFIKPIPEPERHNLLAAYHSRLTGRDELQQMACAKAWSIWEGVCSSLHPSPSLVEQFADPRKALAMARIEAHYFMNGSFLNLPLLAGVHRLKGIPGTLIHGRYDMVCPLDNALSLHQAWPGSQLQIVRDAGHAASEPGITDALIRATDHLVRHDAE
ncbi:MAG: prolyl aminopeptidase [Pseudomonadales bacterium]|nr:prolyl aminopeptidase [Pseudomonadales bacterium]